MHEIVVHLKALDFLKANDAYYRMAIGNSPWPIGVTCVGIHERSAREKISVDQTAHILNDDAQRKYISSIKRLMTFWVCLSPLLLLISEARSTSSAAFTNSFLKHPLQLYNSSNAH